MAKQAKTYLIEHKGQTIECDRVTNVLGATKASAGLAAWYGREERRALTRLASSAQDLASLQATLSALPLDDDDDLFAARLRDTAADSGTGIHALIHCDATGTPLPDDIVLSLDDWRRYQLFETFKVNEGLQYIESEMRVWSTALAVAGTMDLSVMWKGVFWGWDTKTGALRRDAATQMSTYWLLRHETLALKAGDMAEVERMHASYAKGELPEIKWEPLGVLHIDDEKVEVYEIDPDEARNLARNFLYRLQIYRDDSRLRPFRRLYPAPRTLKSGKVQEVKWLRAS